MSPILDAVEIRRVDGGFPNRSDLENFGEAASGTERSEARAASRRGHRETTASDARGARVEHCKLGAGRSLLRGKTAPAASPAERSTIVFPSEFSTRSRASETGRRISAASRAATSRSSRTTAPRGRTSASRGTLREPGCFWGRRRAGAPRSLPSVPGTRALQAAVTFDEPLLYRGPSAPRSIGPTDRDGDRLRASLGRAAPCFRPGDRTEPPRPCGRGFRSPPAGGDRLEVRSCSRVASF